MKMITTEPLAAGGQKENVYNRAMSIWEFKGSQEYNRAIGIWEIGLVMSTTGPLSAGR